MGFIVLEEKGNREKELVGKKTIVDRVDRVEDLVEWRGSRSLSGEVRMNEGQVASGRINNLCGLYL